MKQKLFFLFILTSLLVACSSGPRNPGGKINYFQGNFDDAMKEAGKQNKPVFIYGYTDWCGFCKKMERRTFSEKEVANYLNSHYINLSYNMEQGEGIYIRNKYGLNSYPAYVILDKEGGINSVSFGYMQAEKFLSFVKQP